MSQLPNTNRRRFLQTSTAAGFGYWVAGGVQAAPSLSPNEKAQIASFGVKGKGESDSFNASRFGQMVALCDVDRGNLQAAGLRFNVDKENQFTDFRELFDKLGDKVDAVTVSTPDHNHAVIAVKAMKMGMHCYCQKPMTHSVYEARVMAETAEENGVSTQMGNQFTAYNPMREAAYQIRDGQLGTVEEVHVWTNRPVWPQGEARQEPKAVPASLDWESWIGPAPYRPFAEGYHDFKWRGWWDFGTGALGDMACHTVNLPFMALMMRDPVLIEAETTGHNHDSYPKRSKIRFEFPEHEGRPAFTMYWYDGGYKPNDEQPELFDGFETVKGGNPTASGCVILGSKAKMYAAGDYAQQGIEVAGAERKAVDYPKSTGGRESEVEMRHVKEWFDGMRDSSKKPMSNFVTYGGPLTETILLGNLAVWKADKEGVKATVNWDAKNLKPDDPALEKIVRREYRDGYSL